MATTPFVPVTQPGVYEQEHLATLAEPVNAAWQQAQARGGTGYASPWATAIGQITNLFEGMRQQKFQKLLEEKADREQSERSFLNLVAARMQDPDLTPQAKQALLTQSMKVIGSRGLEEAKGLPKEKASGVKQFFEQMTGGPMKGPSKLNLWEETAKVGSLLENPDFRQSTWNRQMQTEYTDRMKVWQEHLAAKGQVPSKEDAQAIANSIAAKYGQMSPQYAETLKKEAGTGLFGMYTYPWYASQTANIMGDASSAPPADRREQAAAQPSALQQLIQNAVRPADNSETYLPTLVPERRESPAVQPELIPPPPTAQSPTMTTPPKRYAKLADGKVVEVKGVNPDGSIETY